MFLAESKACGHANRAVNFSLVRKALKQGQPIGDCTQCRKGHRTDLKDEAEDATEVSFWTGWGRSKPFVMLDKKSNFDYRF